MGTHGQGKYHLLRTIDNTILTFEELTTLSCQIEGCLNSRPLSKIFDKPSDSFYLTPSHFLIGESITAVPDKDYTQCPANRITRFQYLQKMSQHFWQKWYKE
mgnify:CR=1 FL=1